MPGAKGFRAYDTINLYTDEQPKNIWTKSLDKCHDTHQFCEVRTSGSNQLSKRGVLFPISILVVSKIQFWSIPSTAITV